MKVSLRTKKSVVKSGASKKIVGKSLRTAKKFFAANPSVVARMKTNTNASKLANTFGLMTIPKAIEARGTVLSARADIMRIQFTPKLMTELKDIYAMTVRDQWEYAGVIKCTVRPTDKDYVSFSTPTRRTDRHRMSVAFTASMMQFKMSYHTHPSPRDVRSLVTFPSLGDFKLYVENYPSIQANLILDNEGLYVFDLIESAAGLPDPALAYAHFTRLLELAKAPQFQIVDEIIIYRVDKIRWRSFINNHVDPIMRAKFRISIKFYLYGELPQIRIKDPRPGVQ